MTREGYEILEHTADVGIRAWGPSLAEALERGGEGLADVLGARSDGPGDPRRFHVEAPDAGALAVGFLNELLYLHESEEAAFGPIQVVAATETEVDAQVELVPLAGEPEGVAVKAATYHRLAVERDADRVTLTVYLDVPDRQLAGVPIEHEAARRYLGAMAAAANFARANRHLLADAVRESFEAVFGRPWNALGLSLVYDVAHNLAKMEEHEVDGRPRTLCVHRKGATRAFGPGHRDVPEPYREIGQPVIIPGSMGTHSFVLVGTAEGRERSFWSTCHGAGRAMSRTRAKREMSGHDLVRELRGRGITVAVSEPRLLAEEAPYAYKDVSQVVEVCEGAGLSRTVARLRPVGVVKG